MSNLRMDDICNSPIYIRLGDRMRAPAGFHASTVDGITIKNIEVTDADSRYACLIAGVEGHPVRNVSIENLKINSFLLQFSSKLRNFFKIASIIQHYFVSLPLKINHQALKV